MREEDNRALEKAENIANQKSNDNNEMNIELPTNEESRKIRTDSTKLSARRKREDRAKHKEQNRLKKEKARVVLSREKSLMREEVELKKQQLRKQKQENKHERKMQRARDRQRNKDRNKGLGGWIAAVISLGVTTLVLASILTFNFLMPTEADNALESTYQKAFYDAVTEVNNMDVNLSKIMASNDQSAISGYLVDVAIESELAERDLGELPLEDESKFYTTKVVNQIGDFSKYLHKKITLGESISKSDYETLDRLYQSNLALKNSLDNMMQGMGKDYNFSSMQDNKNTDVVLSGFSDLENLSVSYPELIYDGPFSDGRDNIELKGLSGAEITEAHAREIFLSLFGEQGVDKVESAGSVEGYAPCYNVTAVIKGELAFAQISKAGGKLLLYSYAGSCKEVNYQDDYAIETADNFLNSLDIKGMKPVWINLSNNVYVINYAYENNGVIFYPDMIKIRVCAETNTVIGFEGMGYYTNHTERSVSKPTLSKAEARSKVKADMEIETVRLSVIPAGETAEILCYEFSGKINGATYYAYIDANTGRQAELFKVVENTEGSLLM